MLPVPNMGFDIKAVDAKLAMMDQIERAWSLPSIPDPVKFDLATQEGFNADQLGGMLEGVRDELERKADESKAVSPIISMPGVSIPQTPLVAPAADDLGSAYNRARLYLTEIAGEGPPAVLDGDAVIRFKQEAIRMGLLPENFPLDRTWSPQLNTVMKEMDRLKWQQRIRGDRFLGQPLETLINVADEWLSPSNLAMTALQSLIPDIPHIGEEAINWLGEDRWRKVTEARGPVNKAREFLGFLIGPLDDIVLPVINWMAFASGVGEVVTFARAGAAAAQGGAAVRSVSLLERFGAMPRLGQTSTVGRRLFLGEYSGATALAERTATLQRGRFMERFAAKPVGTVRHKWANQVERWRHWEAGLRVRKANQVGMRLGQLVLLENLVLPSSNPQVVRAKQVLKLRQGKNRLLFDLMDIPFDLGFAPRSIQPEGFWTAPWRGAVRRLREGGIGDPDALRNNAYTQALYDWALDKAPEELAAKMRASYSDKDGGPVAGLRAITNDDEALRLSLANAVRLTALDTDASALVFSLTGPAYRVRGSAVAKQAHADAMRKLSHEAMVYDPEAWMDVLEFMRNEAASRYLTDLIGTGAEATKTYAKHLKSNRSLDALARSRWSEMGAEYRYWHDLEQAVYTWNKLTPQAPMKELRELAKTLGVKGRSKAELANGIRAALSEKITEGTELVSEMIKAHNRAAEERLLEVFTKTDPTRVRSYLLQNFDNPEDMMRHWEAKLLFHAKLNSQVQFRVSRLRKPREDLLEGGDLLFVGQDDSGDVLDTLLGAAPEHEKLALGDVLFGEPEVRSRWLANLKGEGTGSIATGAGVRVDPLARASRPLSRVRLAVARKDEVKYHHLTQFLRNAQNLRIEARALREVYDRGWGEAVARVLARSKERKIAHLGIEEARAVLGELAQADPRLGKLIARRVRGVYGGPAAEREIGQIMARAAVALRDAGVEDLASVVRHWEGELDALVTDSVWGSIGIEGLPAPRPGKYRVYSEFDEKFMEAEAIRRFTAAEVKNLDPELAAQLDELGYTVVFGEFLPDPAMMMIERAPRLSQAGNKAKRGLQKFWHFSTEAREPLAAKHRERRARELVALYFHKLKADKRIPVWFDTDPDGGHIRRLFAGLRKSLGDTQAVAEQQRVAAGSAAEKVIQRVGTSRTPRVLQELKESHIRRALWEIGEEVVEGIPGGKTFGEVLGDDAVQAIYRGLHESRWFGDWDTQMALRSFPMAVEDWLRTRPVRIGFYQVLSATTEAGQALRQRRALGGAAIGGIVGASLDEKNRLRGGLIGGAAGAGLAAAGVGRRLGEGMLEEGERFRTPARLMVGAAGSVLGASAGATLGEEGVVPGAGLGALAGATLGPGVFHRLAKTYESTLGNVGFSKLRRRVFHPFTDKSWHHYNALPDSLATWTHTLRFTLSPVFDLQRYLEGAQLTLVEGDIPADLAAKLPVFGRGRSAFIRHYDESTWTDAVRRYNAAARGDAKFESIADEVVRWVTDEGLFGFNPTHRMVTMFHELERAGMDARQAYETARKVYAYGVNGRTPLELGVNAVFFPFSFQSRLFYRWGKFLADDTARALLIHDQIKMFDHLNERYDLTGIMERHLPVLRQLQKLNAFAFGISPGEFGGIHRPWIDAFLPIGIKAVGGTIEDGPLVTVQDILTGEQGEEVTDFKTLFRRIVPLIRDVRYLWEDAKDTLYATFSSPQHLSPRAESEVAWSLLRAYQADLDDIASRHGHPNWEAFSRKPEAGHWVEGYQRFRQDLAHRFPAWSDDLRRVVEFRFLVDRSFEDKVAFPKTPLDRDIGEMVRFLEGMERAAQAEGVDFGDMETLPPRYFDRIRIKATSLAKRGNGFRDIWSRYYERIYGPIETPIWRSAWETR